MPEYLYYCETCKEEFETTHSITINLQECPKCQAAGLPPVAPKRLIAGGTQFVLAGGGWGAQGYSNK